MCTQLHHTTNSPPPSPTPTTTLYTTTQFFMVPHLFALYTTANVFHYWTKYAEGGTWYAPAPWYANPLILGPFFAFLTAASHGVEPIPPRANMTEHFMSLQKFIGRYKHNPFQAFLIIFVNFVFGTANEVPTFLFLPPPPKAQKRKII